MKDTLNVSTTKQPLPKGLRDEGDGCRIIGFDNPLKKLAKIHV